MPVNAMMEGMHETRLVYELHKRRERGKKTIGARPDMEHAVWSEYEINR